MGPAGVSGLDALRSEDFEVALERAVSLLPVTDCAVELEPMSTAPGTGFLLKSSPPSSLSGVVRGELVRGAEADAEEAVVEPSGGSRVGSPKRSAAEDRLAWTFPRKLASQSSASLVSSIDSGVGDGIGV